MTEPGLRSRRGAHRERRSTLAVTAPLVGVLVALAVVAGGAAVLGQGDGQVVAQRTPEPVEVAPAAPSADVPAQDRSAVAEPVEEAPEDASSAAAEPTADEVEPSSDVPADDALAATFQVAVLNQDGRTGLAATVAQRIEDQGWSVSGTGNFTGTVSATTVYFPPGGEEAAQALAADLPVPGRTRPTFGNLQQDKLTIVITADYP